MKVDKETHEVEITRPFKLLGYATGNYWVKCRGCWKGFIGDKRSYNCLSCAVRRSNEHAG